MTTHRFSPPFMAIRLCETIIVIACLIWCPAATAQWLQWGGPNRNFKVEGGRLAEKWPVDGPKRLWSRDLGGGYSAILADGGTLFTMYHAGYEETENVPDTLMGPPAPVSKEEGREVVIALDAVSGKTKWEYAYPTEPDPTTNLEFGSGPNGTPLLADEYLYSVGFTGIMHCFDKKSGKMLWKHDLLTEFKAKIQGMGYSCSPILYKKLVIVPVGGKQTGLVAFDMVNGKVVWKTKPLDVTYASPILINVDGESQIVFMSALEVIGVAAESGVVRWRHKQPNQWENNCFTPIWDAEKKLLYVSNTDVGSRVIRVSGHGNDFQTKEVWYDQKIKMFHSTGVQIGDCIYGSIGLQPPALMGAIRIADGKVLWKERGFPEANVIYSDGKLIILDEDGQLALAKVSPEKFEVISKVQLLDKVARTVPTLAGDKLYVRNRKQIMALDVGITKVGV